MMLLNNLPIPEFMKNFIVDGKPLFPLANDENKFLGEEVLKKETELSELKVKYEEQQKVNKYCEDHCKAIETELAYLQNLHCMRKNEFETAENLHKVLSRELDWLRKQDGVTKKKIEECQERQASLQKELDSKYVENEKLKSTIQVNHETLEVWLNEAAQREEETLVLLKYRMQNDLKLKELSKQLELTSSEAARWKKLSDEAFNEVVSLQRELQLAADEFRQIHREREDIIAQMETALNHMMKKDKEITQRMMKIEKLQEQENQLTQELDEATRFFEKMQLDNVQLEAKCKSLEKEGSLLRLKIIELEKTVKDLDSEVLTKKMSLNSLETQIVNDRNTLVNLGKELEKKTELLKTTEVKNKKLKEELEAIRSEVLSDEEALKRLTKIQDDKEKYQEYLNKKTIIVQKTKLQVLNENIELKEKEKKLKYEIESVKGALKNLSIKMANAEAQKIQQENQMYRMEYEIFRLEQHIRMLYGHKSQDETEVYEKELEKLKKKLQEKEAYAETLNAEIRENEKELNKVVKRMDDLKMEKESLNLKVNETQLHIAQCYKDLKELNKQKEELMVEECLIKVRLHRLESLLNKKANSVVSLQKQQLEFQNALKEQVKEIENRKEMFIMEIRLAEQERATLANNIAKYNTKIGNLKIRIRVIINTIGISDEEVDNPDIASQVLLKMEKEKDDLTKKIQDTRKEVLQAQKDKDGLKNSIFLIDATLEIYKLILNPINPKDQTELQTMETTAAKLAQKLFQLQREYDKLKNETRTLEEQLVSLETSMEEANEKLQEHQSALNTLAKELNEQNIKLARADAHNQRLLAELKDLPDFPLLEKDMKLRLYRDLNKRVISLIQECINKNPYIKSRITTLFIEHNLPAIDMSSSQLSLPSGSSSTASLNKKRSSALSLKPSQGSIASVVTIDFEGLKGESTADESHSLVSSSVSLSQVSSTQMASRKSKASTARSSSGSKQRL